MKKLGRNGFRKNGHVHGRTVKPGEAVRVLTGSRNGHRPKPRKSPEETPRATQHVPPDKKRKPKTRTGRIYSVNRRFRHVLIDKAARRAAGKGRPSTQQVAEAMVRADRKLLAAQLLESGASYRRIHEHLRTLGYEVSLGTVYIDCQELLGELDDERRRIGERLRARLQMQAENVAVHMAAQMQKGSEQAAAVMLKSLDFQARLNGTYAPTKITAVTPDGNRPYRKLTDAELEQLARASLSALHEEMRGRAFDERAASAVDGETVPERVLPAPTETEET